MTSVIDDFTNYSKELKKEIISDFVNFDSLTQAKKKKLKKIQHKFRNSLYALLIYKLTTIYFEPAEAKRIWFAALNHRRDLTGKLNREVDIEVALLDFFILFKNDLMENPLIIEEKIFEGIKKRILVDELTGLFNYRYYKQRIREEISKSKRYNLSFSVIMLDIDNFKLYNDTYGHIEGNKVLISIAEELKKILRSSDVIIRFGGEEFLIIAPQTTKKEALLIGEKIRKKISNCKFKRRLSVSGGVATYLYDTKDNETTLIKLADAALYRAKYEGKDRICNYFKERRIFKRIPLSEQITFKAKLLKSKAQLKKIKNISKSGISLFVSKPIKKGAMIEGHLEKNKKKITFLGQIMWCSKVDDRLYETGIKFLDTSDKVITNLIFEKAPVKNLDI
ncbi:MAG: diguanylate cyclase [bacterium]|nr:diguanylate cyclase [bacterium]